jgi:hypothetical protein
LVSEAARHERYKVLPIEGGDINMLALSYRAAIPKAVEMLRDAGSDFDKQIEAVSFITAVTQIGDEIRRHNKKSPLFAEEAKLLKAKSYMLMVIAGADEKL